MHPVFEELCRASADRGIRPEALKRWQQIVRTELAPLVDRAEALERENTELKAQAAHRKGKAVA